jgi:hypothetical protein
MKAKFFFIGFLLLYTSTLPAQIQEKIRVKAGEDFSAALSSYGIYRFPAFTTAAIFFRNGRQSSAKINYNLVLGEMQFLDDKGDTLVIANPSELRYLYIDTVLFFYDHNYLEVAAGHDDARLAFAQKIKIDFEKIGAYDRPAAGVDVKTYGSYSSGTGGNIYHLITNEDRIITKDLSYFLIDKYGSAFPATKNNFLRFFSSYKTVTLEYIKTNNIHFSSIGDLKKLFQFCIEQH